MDDWYEKFPALDGRTVPGFRDAAVLKVRHSRLRALAVEQWAGRASFA
jgi:hypothetical protein